MFKDVYLTRTGSFLPNNAVSNNDIEDFLGKIGDNESKSRGIVLKNNGIQSRHYALTKDGTLTHRNAEMVVEALRQELPRTEIEEVDLLACGTSSPDQLIPSHGLMVHGLLSETDNIEVVSPSGVCCAGMHALKYAYFSVGAGYSRKAIASGSELVSPGLRAEYFEEEHKRLMALEENPYIAFEKEFLRWMLSDGAGFFMLEDRPDGNRPCFRINWIEGVSFANAKEPCMVQGAEKSDGEIVGYKEIPPKEFGERSIFSVKQDAKLLARNIVPLGVEGMRKVCSKHDFDYNDIDHLLPHLSSMFFARQLGKYLDGGSLSVAPEKWFTNLETKGNTGSASIYVMLDEFVRTRTLESGQVVFLIVPESARFSYSYVSLTVC